MKQLLTTLSFCFLSLTSFSQNNYDQLVEEGLTALKMRSIPLALTKYKAAYQMDSTKVEANYGLGVAYAFYCHTKKTNCFSSLIF